MLWVSLYFSDSAWAASQQAEPLRGKGFLGADFGAAPRRSGAFLCCPGTGLLHDLDQVSLSCCPSLHMWNENNNFPFLPHLTWLVQLFLSTSPGRSCAPCSASARLWAHRAPHLSLLPSDVFLSSKVRAADFKDSARKRKSIPEVCIFQGDSLGNRTNAIIPDPQEEIASVWNSANNKNLPVTKLKMMTACLPAHGKTHKAKENVISLLKPWQYYRVWSSVLQEALQSSLAAGALAI